MAPSASNAGILKSAINRAGSKSAKGILYIAFFVSVPVSGAGCRSKAAGIVSQAQYCYAAVQRQVFFCALQKFSLQRRPSNTGAHRFRALSSLAMVRAEILAVVLQPDPHDGEVDSGEQLHPQQAEGHAWRRAGSFQHPGHGPGKSRRQRRSRKRIARQIPPKRFDRPTMRLERVISAHQQIEEPVTEGLPRRQARSPRALPHRHARALPRYRAFRREVAIDIRQAASCVRRNIGKRRLPPAAFSGNRQPPHREWSRHP